MSFFQHQRSASGPGLLLAWAILLSTLSLAACGGSGNGAGNDALPPPPVTDGGGDPPPPIAGNPGDPLASAMVTFFADDPVPESETSIDAHNRKVVRTRIQVDFVETATIGQANELLIGLGATIHASVEGLPNLVLRIPDPGSLSALDTLVTDIRNNPNVFAVLKSVETERRGLPENIRSLIFDGQGEPEADGDWRFVGQHLAVRGAAAWNVAEAASGTPAMIFADAFPLGKPEDGNQEEGFDPAFVFDVDSLLGTPLGYTKVELPPECIDPRLEDQEDCEKLVDERQHGYWTLGIATGVHWDSARDERDLFEHVTGIVPMTSDLLISNDYQEEDRTADARLIADIRAAAASRPGMIVVNRSSGNICDTATLAGDPCVPIDSLRDRVRSFIRSIRWFPDLEGRVLLVSAVGNRRQDEGAEGAPFVGTHDASTDSVINAAALNPSWPDRFDQNALPALENVLSVENARRTPRYVSASNTQDPALGPGTTFRGQCTSNSSFIGGHIAGVGSGGVYSSIGGDDTENREDGGTSSAAPQVAGLAAYMSALDPSLTPQETIDILTSVATPLPRGSASEDCSTVDPIDHPRAPLIDAYASVLALDSTGSINPSNAKIRNALLDVTGPDGIPDTKFDLLDLDVLLPKVNVLSESGAGVLDYSRFDLNGDGFTGGQGGARFDLDIDDVTTSNAFSSVINVDLLDALDTTITFNENAVTDLQVVCYYAYTDLFVGDTTLRDNRMRPFATDCACEGTSPSNGFPATASLLSAPAETGGQCLVNEPELLIAGTAVREITQDGFTGTVGSVDVFKVGGDGSTITRMTFDADPFRPSNAGNPAWSPDRGRIAYTWNADTFHDIWVMDSDGANQQKLTTSTFQAIHLAPEWSPDGRKIAYTTRANSGSQSEIWVMNADGSDKQLMLSSNVLIFELSWSPDGRKMLYTEGVSFRDPVTIRLADVVVEVIEDVETWSLRNPVSFAGAEAINRSPDWSPDGSRIAFSSQADVSSDRNIYTVASDGTDLVQITGPDAPVDFGGFQLQIADSSPSWSPDGSRLAIVRTVPPGGSDAEDSTSEVFIVNPDGTGLVQLTPTNLNLTVHEVAWSN